MNRMIVVASMAAMLATGACFASSGSSATAMDKTPAAAHHTEKAKPKAHHKHHHKAKHHANKVAKAEKSKEATASKKAKKHSPGDSDK